MSIKFTIRAETPKDNELVSLIVQCAFDESERGYNGEAELVALLRQSDGYFPSLSLVAGHLDTLIGHIILSRVYINTSSGKIPTLILAPVSVHPDYQNRGVGSALIQAVHKAAILLGECHVFLVGHAEYYPKFGYRPSRYLGITFPEGRDDDNCMGIELVKGSLDGIAGSLEYSQPFYSL